MNETAAARAVIEEYVDACRAGSVERLKAVFHPQALMSGYLADQCLVGSPQPFYDAVAGAPAPGPDYAAQITVVDVTGNVAAVTLREQNLMGMDFTDYFHLVKIDGTWKILSKTFTSESGSGTNSGDSGTSDSGTGL